MDSGISAADYNFKMKQIDADMAHYMKLQEGAQYKITDAWKVTAETVLELAKEAKDLWKVGSLTEKLEILKALLEPDFRRRNSAIRLAKAVRDNCKNE